MFASTDVCYDTMGLPAGIHRVYNIGHMADWKEKLDKRAQEIEKTSQDKSEKEKREEIERATDIVRLRGLLEELKVRSKLEDVRRTIWKEGQINELVEYSDRAQGMDISLHLYTSYPDLEVAYYSYAPRIDFFGKEMGGYGKDYFPGWSGVYIQIGITNVHSTKDTAMYQDRLLGDYIYASFGKGRSIVDRKKDMIGHFFGCDNRINIPSNRLVVPNFIEDQLLKFTEHDKLPSSLKAEGLNRIRRAKPNY